MRSSSVSAPPPRLRSEKGSLVREDPPQQESTEKAPDESTQRSRSRQPVIDSSRSSPAAVPPGSRGSSRTRYARSNTNPNYSPYDHNTTKLRRSQVTNRSLDVFLPKPLTSSKSRGPSQAPATEKQQQEPEPKKPTESASPRYAVEGVQVTRWDSRLASDEITRAILRVYADGGEDELVASNEVTKADGAWTFGDSLKCTKLDDGTKKIVAKLVGFSPSSKSESKPEPAAADDSKPDGDDDEAKKESGEEEAKDSTDDSQKPTESKPDDAAAPAMTEVVVESITLEIPSELGSSEGDAVDVPTAAATGSDAKGTLSVKWIAGKELPAVKSETEEPAASSAPPAGSAEPTTADEEDARRRNALIKKWQDKLHITQDYDPTYAPKTSNEIWDATHDSSVKREDPWGDLYDDGIAKEKRSLFQAGPKSFYEVHRMWVGLKEETRDPTMLPPVKMHAYDWNTFLRVNRYDAWGRRRDESNDVRRQAAHGESRSGWHHAAEKHMSQVMLRPSFRKKQAADERAEREKQREERRKLDEKLFANAKGTRSTSLRRQCSESPARPSSWGRAPSQRSASARAAVDNRAERMTPMTSRKKPEEKPLAKVNENNAASLRRRCSASPARPPAWGFPKDTRDSTYKTDAYWSSRREGLTSGEHSPAASPRSRSVVDRDERSPSAKPPPKEKEPKKEEPKREEQEEKKGEDTAEKPAADSTEN